jgi:hypothetical protein
MREESGAVAMGGWTSPVVWALVFALTPCLAGGSVGCTVSFTSDETDGGGADSAADAESALCGDDLREESEECDGPDLGGETCQTLGFPGGELGCDEQCNFVVSDCLTSECGNGLIEELEVCDGDNLAGQTCETLGAGEGFLSCRHDCSGFDTSGCALLADGEACSIASDCGGGICWTQQSEGFPGGYCTRSTESGCPYGSVEVNTLGGIYCFQRCDSSAQCRPGYACFDRYGQGETVCWPHCETLQDCSGEICNYWSGRCEPAGDGGDNGFDCDPQNTCKGDCTVWPELPDVGYCVSPCSLSSGACPSDDACADVYEGARGDLGLCLDACEVDDECRSGFSCKEGGYDAGLLCIP